uniref:Uncharacterized protein n=1 Tax=Megaselia scalaris TaxID=36166 RepID=T1GI77_MEGSC
MYGSLICLIFFECTDTSIVTTKYVSNNNNNTIMMSNRHHSDVFRDTIMIHLPY